ncbi:MAG TPA: response regulator [Ideonella sp.]|nr:response regulator [Ideonella sp.]
MSVSAAETDPAGEPHRRGVEHEPQVLDASLAPAFDALVRAARLLTGSQAAAITVVSGQQVRALASCGLPPGEPLSRRATAAGPGFFELPDTAQDAALLAQARALGQRLPASYAAVSLQVDGAAPGTLCVMGEVPRALSGPERAQLEGLASVAVALLSQQQARQSLGLQIDRLTDLARASGDWMWETDEQGRYGWISGDFERLTGLAPQACMGQPVADEPLVDAAGELLPSHGTLLDQLQRREPFARVTTRLTTPLGPLYVSRSAQPVFDAQGGFRGFRGTARDVTALKQAQQAQREHEALRRQIEIGERASRDKSEFLSRVSHELRTPHNAILGFAQLMTLDVEPPLSGMQWNRLDGVRQAGQALLKLIDELLEVSLPGPSASGLAAEGQGGPAAAAPAAPAPAAPAKPSRVVLYIEDEPLNIVLMQEIFRAQPEWTLHVARDGSEGVEMALALQPDLALVDMNLPDFNGIEVLRRLRAAPSLQGLRCIALSADAMAEQIAAARAAGFDDYWTKPIDLTRLLAAVARVFDGP